MAWCLDANIFINSARLRFPPDIFPGFWRSLFAAFDDGRCVAIDEVKKELIRGDDEIATWAKTASFLANDDALTIAAMDEVVAAMHAHRPPYREHGKTRFLEGADPWVLAFCKAYGHTLVTQETASPTSLKSVKIPDIAHAVGVNVIDLNGMLRALNIKFQ